MQVSAATGKARVFLKGVWSAWMDKDTAQKLEDRALYGERPYRGIFLLADAQRLGLAPTSLRGTRKSRGTN